jgi:Arc/MetJ-type ribon-helix-helix transcriptional regulator
MSRVISTDVPNDLAEEIEEAREEEESRSAAVRRLIRAGLDSEGSSLRDLPTRRMMILAGTLTIFVATSPPEPIAIAIGAIGIVLSAAGGLLELAALRG